MGERSFSYESLDSAPKKTFWVPTVGEIVSKLSDDMYSSSPSNERGFVTG
jgi:hypothetical protein